MLKCFDEEIYHERNKVETIMFLLKHNSLVARARKSGNKIKELAWKILSYNIERLAKSLRLWLAIISLDTAVKKGQRKLTFSLPYEYHEDG